MHTEETIKRDVDNLIMKIDTVLVSFMRDTDMELIGKNIVIGRAINYFYFQQFKRLEVLLSRLEEKDKPTVIEDDYGRGE